MEGGAERKGRNLDVRRCYHPSRMSQAVLASVYEQLVARGRTVRPARSRAEPDFEKDLPQPQPTLCAGG